MSGKTKNTYVYYCNSCDKWRGKNTTCPECGAKTIKKNLTSARGDFYFIEGVSEPLKRVTNILKVINQPGLNYWVAKQAVLVALENPLLSVGEAMAARFKKRDKKGAIGTDIHKAIERIAKGETLSDEEWEAPQMKAYKKFCDKVPHTIISSEETVYSEKYAYAGTLDAIVKYGDGSLGLLDWKTSKSVYPVYGLQLSAYLHALAEMKNDEKILENYSVHVVLLEADGNYQFQAMPDCWKQFKAALILDRWQNN